MALEKGVEKEIHVTAKPVKRDFLETLLQEDYDIRPKDKWTSLKENDLKGIPDKAWKKGMLETNLQYLGDYMLWGIKHTNGEMLIEFKKKIPYLPFFYGAVLSIPKSKLKYNKNTNRFKQEK